MHLQERGVYSLSPDPAEEISPCYAGLIQAVASAGPLLVLFTFTVPLTTLTSTAEALSAGSGVQAWILSAMSVGAAGRCPISFQRRVPPCLLLLVIWYFRNSGLRVPGMSMLREPCFSAEG